MNESSFVIKMIRNGSIPIHFVQCRDKRNRDCYFFIACSSSKIATLQYTREDKLNIYDYGNVLASGFGKYPSAEVKVLLKEKYHFDAHNLSG